MRDHAESEEALARAPRAERVRSGEPAVGAHPGTPLSTAGVMSLQRSLGNAATAAYLTAEAPAVQRQGEGEEEEAEEG